MSDPAIKLFGKTIPLSDNPAAANGEDPLSPSSDPTADGTPNQDLPSSPPNSSPENNCGCGVGEELELDKDPSQGCPTDTNQPDGIQALDSQESADPNGASVMNEDQKTSSVENEAATLKASKTEEEQNETDNPQEKTLKKPDKILPCPRCNSMDTKFCYFNNYNVNQPRHFCKKCQRYWTAGGTMRNVPVGAGRRKNKNSTLASHYRHVSVAEALQNAQADLPNGIHHSKPNGTVLTFGSSDIPLCESMASVLSIDEKTMQNCRLNGFHKQEEYTIPVSPGDAKNGNDHSSESSVIAANSKDEIAKKGLVDPVMQNCHLIPSQVPCFPGAPWPYPWNPAQWTPSVPPPGFGPQGFPMPFYPAGPYWGCSVPGAWNIWVSPPTFPPNQTAPSSGPNSPTLGKHSREENLPTQTNTGETEPQKESNPEKCLWIPKTLRIDDPGEAAKSSIWATLGIKNEKADSFSGAGGPFRAFRPKGNEEYHISETSRLLQANPAALSRSLDFHERS